MICSGQQKIFKSTVPQSSKSRFRAENRTQERLKRKGNKSIVTGQPHQKCTSLFCAGHSPPLTNYIEEITIFNIAVKIISFVPNVENVEIALWCDRNS